MSNTEMNTTPAPPSLPTRDVLWKRVRETYFSSRLNTGITLFMILFFVLVLPQIVQWAILDAVFIGDAAALCEQASGACWLPIADRAKLFVYGFFPDSETWRVNIVFLASFLTLIVLVWKKVNMQIKLIYVLFVLPTLTFTLLYGGVFGLERVSSNDFGGLVITVFLGLIGSILSLPVSIFLALGRRSEMPIIRSFCIFVIEVLRAMPMITWLFMAVLILQLFLPEGTEFDKMVRVVILLILVSAAGKAEIIRARLQAIPKGQYEAAAALGVGYWKTTTFIIMPQVLKISIPALLNSFIGLFKDTSLVAIIGLLDFLAVGISTMESDEWGRYAVEVYIFVALVYFVILFTISRFSLTLERQLKTDH